METVDGVLDPTELDAGGPLYAGPRYESPFGLEEGLSERDRERCESFARDGFLIIDDLELDDVDEPAAELHRDPESTRRTQVTHYMFDGCIHYAPRLRDVRSGRMGYLHYRDIRTGEWRRPTFGNNRVRAGLNDTARFMGKELAYNVGLRRYLRCYS